MPLLTDDLFVTSYHALPSPLSPLFLGVEVNKVSISGRTAFMWAACNGYTEIVRVLLAAPAIDHNKRLTSDYCHGYTALGLAMANGRVMPAVLLAAAAAKRRLTWTRGTREAPAGTGRRIYDAVDKGDMAALRPLVQEWSGHDVLNWANPDTMGGTPLIIGSCHGRLEAVRLLLATPGEAWCCPLLN